MLTRKDLIVSLTKDTALPGEQSANFVRSKITFKFPRNESDYKKKEKQNHKPTNQKQSRSSKKPFDSKVEEDGEENYYKVVENICTLNQECDHKKGFSNLLLSKNRIPMNLQTDSGSTCSILPLSVFKDVNGDHDM